MTAAYIAVGAGLIAVGAALLARVRKDDPATARAGRLPGLLLILSGAVFIATGAIVGRSV